MPGVARAHCAGNEAVATTLQCAIVNCYIVNIVNSFVGHLFRAFATRKETVVKRQRFVHVYSVVKLKTKILYLRVT